MDSYIAETESRVDELLKERAELMEDIESLQRENNALHELVDDLSKRLEEGNKKDTAGTMSE